MTSAEHRNRARGYLLKATEYLESAAENLRQGRNTVASGDAIHAGISAKDAIVTALTGATPKGKDHGTAPKELRRALGARPQAAPAEKALRDLISKKSEVEYGVALVTPDRANFAVRRAQTLVGLATDIVRLRQ